MAALRIYDAQEMTCNFSGIPLESGLADGEFLRVENAEDAFMTVVGTDGEVTRSKSGNKMATVTVILMQSSSGNQALSTLHNLDIETGNGAGVGPLLIRDRQGTAVYAASKAWIRKAPDASFDRTATSREWAIDCADLKRLDGGN